MEIHVIIAKVSYPLTLYRCIERAYHKVQFDAAEAAQPADLYTMNVLFIQGQPLFLDIFDIDPAKPYLDAWSRTSKKLEEAQSGVATLKGEVRQLDQMGEVLHKTCQQLKQVEQIVQNSTAKEDRREMGLEGGELNLPWGK